MPDSAYFSNHAPIFRGVAKPCPGWVVGYAAIIEKLNLPLPLPAVKAMVSEYSSKIRALSRWGSEQKADL